MDYLIYLVLLVYGFLCEEAQAAKILVVPMPAKSHLFYLTAAVEELVIKGHDVYTLQPSYWEDPKALIKLNYKVLKYPA